MFTGDSTLTGIRREVISELDSGIKDLANSPDPKQWLEILDFIIQEARDAKEDISVAREI